MEELKTGVGSLDYRWFSVGSKRRDSSTAQPLFAVPGVIIDV